LDGIWMLVHGLSRAAIRKFPGGFSFGEVRS
jgi:hypothetical protein